MRRDTSRLAERLASLPALSSDELKDEWKRSYGAPLPKRALRHFLISAIAYRLQEQALGGLERPSTVKLLERVAADAASGKPVSVQTSPNRQGTVLIREWQGVNHQVEILERGVRYQDKHYGSLSEVARLITGSHWSGPAFFGLKKR